MKTFSVLGKKVSLKNFVSVLAFLKTYKNKKIIVEKFEAFNDETSIACYKVLGFVLLEAGEKKIYVVILNSSRM